MAFAAVALSGLSFVKAGPPLLMHGFVGPIDPGPIIPDPNNPSNFMSGWMYNYDDLGLPLIDVTNVVPSNGISPAYWDRHTDPEWSAWTVGTEALAIFETIDGVNGWTGANYTGSTDELLDDASTLLEFPDTNLYPIPTIVATLTAPDTIDVTWTGMNDDMGANIVNYTVYHSPDGVVYSQVGFSTPQVIGNPVGFTHTPVTYGLHCYNIAVNYRRDAGGGIYTTIGRSNSVCMTLPTILSTYPVNGAVNIPINADIIVNFSHTMDTTTWKWSITPDPGGVWTDTWSQTTVLNDTVTLSHAIDFLPCTLYTVTVEYANESSTGQGIIPNLAAPNPWSFTTVCLNPQIISTDPVNNTFNIPLGYPVTITFSKQINTPTFAWQIEQGTDPGGWTETWDPTDTIVTLNHAPNLFAENDHLCFNVTAADDMFINPLIAGPVPNPWCFDTESVPPYIIDTDPWDGEPGVELNPSIYVNYSEDMATVGLDTIPICASTWTANMVTLRYAIFTCTIQPFLEGQTVIATATGLDNQTLPLAAPTQWTFDTISVQPQIVLTSPPDGDIDVPLNEPIVIDFSEQINTATWAWNIAPDPGGWSEAWDPTDTIVTLSHTNLFTECETYTVTVTDADDMSGLTLAAGPVPNPWSFAVICIPPEIVTTSPADGVIDVAVTDPIIIDFSEQINTATWAWNIAPDPTGWTEAWTPGDQTVTLSHSTNFDECRPYTVTVITANDMSGIGLIPGAVPNPWSFWAFCPEPVIVNRSPGDGATAVPLNEPIVVTFSKSMNTALVTYSVLPDPGLTAIWTQTSLPDDTLTLTHGGFTEVTLYTVDVDGQDTDGLDLNRTASAPLPWTFTTIGVPPNVVEPTTPADLEASVAVAQDIIIQFTETMDTTAGQFVYTVTPDPGTLAHSWSQTVYLDDTVTITHDDFLECVQYTVEITAARDDSAVDLDPLPYSFTFWAFCVEPFVTTTDPTDGVTGVSVSQNVLIRFSEPMATGTVTVTFSPPPGNEVPNWDGVDMNLTMTHDDFAPLTTYTVTITGEDPDGNQLNCTLGLCSFTFMTASEPPTVSITVPDGTEVWSGGTAHDITWDMDDDVTLPADLEVWLNYTSTIFGDGTIAGPLIGLTTHKWTPVCPIDADDVVVVIEVYDGERQVATNTSAAFTIDCTPPTVDDTTPAIGATDVLPLSADIVINFSEAIGNFDWTISPDPGGWSESWTADNMNVTLSHSVDFAVSTMYTVNITTLTTDASDPGNNLTPAYVFTFTTGEPNQPPDADAGPDQTVKVDDTVHFNGTGSSDPDGDTLTYTWDFGDDTTGTGAEPTHTYTEAGTYTVTLTVDDGHGGTATDEMIVTVEEKEADFLSEYWWIFLILIIIIILIIVVVATRRKKPEEEEYIEEEEEEVPPPPEEEVEEVVEEVPEEEAEYIEEEPVEEAPLEEEAPVEEAPAEEPIEEAPMEEAPAEEAVPVAAPVEAEEAPAEEPAEEAPAEGKVCPNCGTIVGEDDTTCFICGTEL